MKRELSHLRNKMKNILKDSEKPKREALGKNIFNFLRRKSKLKIIDIETLNFKYYKKIEKEKTKKNRKDFGAFTRENYISIDGNRI